MEECGVCMSWVTCGECRYKRLQRGSIRDYRCQACLLRSCKDADALRSGLEKYQKRSSDAESRVQFLRNKVPAHPSTTGVKAFMAGDIAFVVQGNEDLKIHAHRFILAGKSSVFEGMFEGTEGPSEISITDTTHPVMRAVVNFCYTSDICFTQEAPAEDVLDAAHRFAIAHLKRICEAELCKWISAENLTDMVQLSCRVGAKRLRGAAMRYFKEHFDTVEDRMVTLLETLVVQSCESDIVVEAYGSDRDIIKEHDLAIIPTGIESVARCNVFQPALSMDVSESRDLTIVAPHRSSNPFARRRWLRRIPLLNCSSRSLGRRIITSQLSNCHLA